MTDREWQALTQLVHAHETRPPDAKAQMRAHLDTQPLKTLLAIREGLQGAIQLSNEVIVTIDELLCTRDLRVCLQCRKTYPSNLLGCPTCR